MTDWRATLAICRRELAAGRCCLGLNAKAHGWCSVDRHADKWKECGMEPPNEEGELMKGEILPPVEALSGLEIEWRPPVDLGPKDRKRFWGRSFTSVYRAGVAAFVTAGRILIEVKAELPHGEWLEWLDQYAPISERTAQQLMQIGRDENIGRRAGLIRNTDSDLPQDRALLVELCGHDPETFDRWEAEGVIHAEMKRGDVRRRIVEERHGGAGQAEPPALPDARYGVILADPPWPFDTRGEGGKGRAADNHYPSMPIGHIKQMGNKISDRAAADAALFLWTTSDRLEDALSVLGWWGFTYRSTAFVWVKEGAPGLGYWTRKGAEICLLGTRGSPKRLAADVPEVIHAPRGRHSEKPEEVYERIERLVGGPYLELFARKARPGWDAWGNDPALKEEQE